MNNFLYFTHRFLHVAYKINLNSHQRNLIECKLNNYNNSYEKRNNSGQKNVETNVDYISWKIKQYNFNYQTAFSARFDEQDEDDQVLDEIELSDNLNTSEKSRESKIDTVNDTSQLEQQVENQETKDSDWRFDKCNLTKVYLCKTN